MYNLEIFSIITILCPSNCWKYKNALLNCIFSNSFLYHALVMHDITYIKLIKILNKSLVLECTLTYFFYILVNCFVELQFVRLFPRQNYEWMKLLFTLCNVLASIIGTSMNLGENDFNINIVNKILI